MALSATPTQAQRLAFCDYLEQQYENTLKKMIASTEKQALGELLDLLELPAEIESQFIRDMAVSGILAKDWTEMKRLGYLSAFKKLKKVDIKRLNCWKMSEWKP